MTGNKTNMLSVSPSGYHYSARLSICIQSPGGCSNSPCSFGCHSSPSNSRGRQAFSCDCPQGYHSVGDGHCVSTVNPSGFSSLSSTWDYEEEEEEEEEYISTEGCFSCQINGFPGRKNKKSHRRHSSRQGKRRRNRRSRNKRSSPQLTYRQNMLEAVGVREVGEVEERVHFSNNISVHLKLDRQQTRNRQRVVKLQPAREDLGHSLVYSIVQDPTGLLAIKRKAGVWGLFFSRRVSQPMVFHVRVKGELKKGPTSKHNFDLHALFKIEIS